MTNAELYDLLLAVQDAIFACQDQDEPWDTDGKMQDCDLASEKQNELWANRCGLDQ